MKILSLILLITSSFCFAQNTTGRATYIIILDKNNELRESNNNDKYTNEALDLSKKIEYTLVFKDHEANFFTSKNDFDSSIVNRINILAFDPQNIYTNSKEKYFIKETYSNNQFIHKNEFVIKESSKLKWKITKESKIVGNYLCYKATTIKEIHDTNEIIKEKVIAWFCPSLPYSFGPKEYMGLPGLILELQEEHMDFIVKNVDLENKDVVTIEKPKGKKAISEKEFNKIVDERLKIINNEVMEN